MQYPKEQKFEDIFRMTKILRSPGKSIPTFGVSEIQYYFLASLDLKKTIVREGSVHFEKPRIITAKELGELFEGYGPETEEFINQIYGELSGELRILGYQFKHRPRQKKTMLDSFSSILARIKQQIKDEKTCAVITGIETSYELSVLKLTLETISRSLSGNFTELEERGFFAPPEERHLYRIKLEIETLFRAARQDPQMIKTLGRKLNDYKLFKEYEDRFFSLISKKK